MTSHDGQRTAMKTPGWLTYATGAGAIITGLGCKLMLVVCTLMTVVGAWLRCFNSRCIWHQEHQMQKQETPMSFKREPCGETKRKMFKVLNLTAFHFYSTWNSVHELYINHTLMLYLCRMAFLRDKTAGGTTTGIPPAVSMAGLMMSHNGRHVFSPNLPDTVQAKKGQHQKP